MQPVPHTPPLRLVTTPVASSQHVMSRRNAQVRRAARSVQAENLAAAAGRFDSFPVFATAVARELTGTRGALAPDRRKALLVIASQTGLRPFDANLIIALFQDRARRGEALDPMAFNHFARFVGSPPRVKPARMELARGLGLAVLCLGLAAAWAAAIVAWILN